MSFDAEPDALVEALEQQPIHNTCHEPIFNLSWLRAYRGGLKSGNNPRDSHCR
jgi:hypothetical protein